MIIKRIDRFDGPYRFLSNFWVEPDGTHVEGEYQAAKCANPADIARFAGLTPGAAKRLGRKVNLRPDWDAEKVSVMYDLVLHKFSEHPTLRKKLAMTGTAELIEGNYWNDTFWGVCNGAGRNELGKILMIVRTELCK